MYWLAGGGGVILLMLSGFFWWNTTSVNPERVFWGTIESNLTTQGVTLQTTRNNGTTKSEQQLQLDFGPEAKARSLTTLTQGKAVVKTENLSLSGADYTRYVDVKVAPKDGKKQDTSKLVGVWARTDDGKNKNKTPQLFGQTLLGLSLPFGNLPAEQRENLLRLARENNVYDTKFDKVKKQHKDGRLQYQYTVKLQPILYIRFMKEYAKSMGLHDLDQVDPNSYSRLQPLDVAWTVDAHSRNLVEADYGNGHKETYAGYGLHVTAAKPKHAISGQELQQRLSAVQ